MAGAVFYIEYNDGKITQIKFQTPARARQAYNLYSKEVEDEAKSFGWEVIPDQLTLTQQLRERRVAAQAS
mgnify:CR=1 FL=1